MDVLVGVNWGRADGIAGSLGVAAARVAFDPGKLGPCAAGVGLTAILHACIEQPSDLQVAFVLAARRLGLLAVVLAALGSVETGWSLFIDGDRLVYVNNLPRVGKEIVSDRPVPVGASTVAFRFTPDGAGTLSGEGTLLPDRH